MQLFSKRIKWLMLWTVLACLSSQAADVVVITKDGPPSPLQNKMSAVIHFYGLNENLVHVTKVGALPEITKAIQDARTVAVVVDAAALPLLDERKILSALAGRAGTAVPLLIAGVDEETNVDLLAKWSSGRVRSCKTSVLEEASSYHFAKVEDLTYELGGNQLPTGLKDVRYLELNGSQDDWIIAASDHGHSFPVFVRSRIGAQEIFFATLNGSVEEPSGPSPYEEPRIFASLAPEMIFVRHAGGARVWHSPGRYANFTIDDAWLREPYGYLNYKALLREMQEHSFHSTIAFVPWNFDRSQTEVVSLFQQHADRFSICVHGNNHDHQEFASYDIKPLGGQENDIKQSLARMARFSELTHIPYDPVMVFPHSISPEKTFELLKRYNFWSTANSLNVPMGAGPPADTGYALRTATLAFANFPSLRRYSAEAPGPESQLVVDAFLGNPMLFYAHQGFFSSGIDAFNKTADAVNRLQPSTQWQSLGSIAQHLYLEKLRDDGNYDVKTYSAKLHLENRHPGDTTFFVEKDEDFTLPLTVTVDGKPYPYHETATQLLIDLPTHAGTTHDITIRYGGDLNLAAIDVSNTSLRIAAIRYLSDFRDNDVSKLPFGQQFIAIYTQNENGWNAALAGLAVLLGVVVSAWLLQRRRIRKKGGPAPNGESTAAIPI
jgi:peptidoglycan/xylan/chitin deacetylase (PgdA/CDA1 family)